MDNNIDPTELLKQRMEDSLDYLIEQLDSNPMDTDAWQFYFKQLKDAHVDYVQTQSAEWLKQMAEIQPIPDIFKKDE